jgi:hypothetical protein
MTHAYPDLLTQSRNNYPHRQSKPALFCLTHDPAQEQTPSADAQVPYRMESPGPLWVV